MTLWALQRTVRNGYERLLMQRLHSSCSMLQGNSGSIGSPTSSSVFYYTLPISSHTPPPPPPHPHPHPPLHPSPNQYFQVAFENGALPVYLQLLHTYYCIS